MADRHLSDGVRLGEAQVNGDAAAARLILLLRAPEGYASANGTEVELDCFTSDIRLGGARDLNSFIFVVIRPEYAVAPTYGAVAGCCAVGLPFELPSNCAAVAGPLDHFNVFF